jgi:hypothetical protein
VRAEENDVALREAPEDYDAWVEFAFEHGWSDGLPVVPPTRRRVEAALAEVSLDPEHVVGSIAPVGGAATVAKIAANAVMAGCSPQLLPIVVTAVEALIEPPFGLNSVQVTTNPATAAVMVSGPLAAELGFGWGGNCLGGEYRGNATLGRALRLIMRNIGGAVAGVDASTQGQPAKWSLAFAENSERNPWSPYRVDLGLDEASTAVTVIPASGTQSMLETAPQAGDLIASLGRSARSPTGNDYLFVDSEPWLVLCPEHAELLARSGYSKADVRAAFWSAARLPLGEFTSTTVRYRLIKSLPESPEERNAFLVPLSASPDRVHVVVAGGPGAHSVFMPTIGSHQCVTKPVTCALARGGGPFNRSRGPRD